MVRRRVSAVFTMLRMMDRFSRRLPFCLWACATLPQLACTLVTDVDRSKIPAPAIIEPDPEPEPEDVDAGAGDAGPDPGEAADGGTDAESDAGAVETADAQAGG
jgi:hypothetical protein